MTNYIIIYYVVLVALLFVGAVLDRPKFVFLSVNLGLSFPAFYFICRNFVGAESLLEVTMALSFICSLIVAKLDMVNFNLKRMR